MIDSANAPTPQSLLPALERMWSLSAGKIRRIQAEYDST